MFLFECMLKCLEKYCVNSITYTIAHRDDPVGVLFWISLFSVFLLFLKNKQQANKQKSFFFQLLLNR